MDKKIKLEDISKYNKRIIPNKYFEDKTIYLCLFSLSLAIICALTIVCLVIFFI